MSALRKPEPVCCTGDCDQGRRCSVRAACHLPETDERPWRFHFGLKSWWLHLNRWHLQWAMSEMSPLDPEMPKAVRDLHAVEEQLRRLG